MRLVIPLVLLIGLGVLLFLPHMSSVPDVFADTPFDQALEQATQSGKVLVVSASATWCPPCKQMDQTTWKDATLARWIGSNGIAVRIDVDQQTEMARRLGVEAVPTVIAFKDGRELGRVVGYRSADELIGWLGR